MSLHRVKLKKFYSSSTSDPQNLLSSPLSRPILGFQQKGGDAKFNPHSKTRVTKLSNGLTVASEDHWGSFATLGGKIDFLCHKLFEPNATVNIGIHANPFTLHDSLSIILFIIVVLTNAGSRNEVAYLGGINHFLEKLAYNVSL